jgi:hypothetical protein
MELCALFKGPYAAVRPEGLGPFIQIGEVNANLVILFCCPYWE